jgi:hypothetical protein
VIYVPNLKNLTEQQIMITPDNKQVEFEYFEGSNAGKLSILPSAKGGRRKIVFTNNR